MAFQGYLVYYQFKNSINKIHGSEKVVESRVHVRDISCKRFLSPTIKKHFVYIKEQFVTCRVWQKLFKTFFLLTGKSVRGIIEMG